MACLITLALANACPFIDVSGFSQAHAAVDGLYEMHSRLNCEEGPMLLQSRAVHARGQRHRYGIHTVIDKLYTVVSRAPILCVRASNDVDLFSAFLNHSKNIIAIASGSRVSVTSLQNASFMVMQNNDAHSRASRRKNVRVSARCQYTNVQKMNVL